MSRTALHGRPVVAFVGTLVPDEPAFHGPAFNRAGQMFQEELVRGLTKAGCETTAVFAIEPIPAFPRSRRLFGRSGVLTTARGTAVRLLPFFNIQPLKALTAGLSVSWALVRWGWRHRDREKVIHCVNLTMPPGIFLLLGARLAGAKAVVSILDVWRPGMLVPDTWPWRLDFWLQRHLIPRFDGHMVVSQAIADDLAPGRSVCRVEGGVNPERFTLQPGPRVRAEGEPFRLVLAGSLEPYNGVELALDALAHLPADIELVIAGTGSLVDRVRQAAAADARVIYKGFLGFDDVLRLYTSADLLLNARITRSMDTRYFFPSKLMECLMSGTPVLSTCTGQVEEEYGSVLYLLRDETPAALAAAVIDIARRPSAERQALGQRARAFMLAHKTWERQTQKLAEYISADVLGAERTPA